MDPTQEIGRDEHGHPVFAGDPTPPPGWASDDGEVIDFFADEEWPVDCGGGVYLGPQERPRWRHLCGVLRPDGRRVALIDIGMDLNRAHVVTRSAAGITIRASILCPRCGTHGFVTDSRWASC